jgi:hypothetical protein
MSVIPVPWKEEVGKFTVQVLLNKKLQILSEKITTPKRTRGVAQVVQHLPQA